MRQGGDSYYVLVNNKDEIYTLDDTIEGEMICTFDTEKEAQEELIYLLESDELDPDDGWHVERHRW